MTRHLRRLFAGHGKVVCKKIEISMTIQRLFAMVTGKSTSGGENEELI